MNKYYYNSQLVKSLNFVLYQSAPELLAQCSIPQTTWYKLMQCPTDITIQQLLSIANSLHIPVRRFFSTSPNHTIGLREDYVVEPYTPCRYDTDVLRHIINDNRELTWQHAADALGMSRQRLRDSLLGSTRTPVARFLDACYVLGIDPFRILIDPNPTEVKKKNIKEPKSKSADPFTDITILYRRIDILSLQVRDLQCKYEELLTTQNALLHHTSLINPDDEEVSSLAAEPNAK